MWVRLWIWHRRPCERALCLAQIQPAQRRGERPMDTLTFDAATRRVARTRRSALGLVAGAVLATAVHPVEGGNNDNDNDKKDEKRCRREAARCAGHWSSECEAA